MTVSGESVIYIKLKLIIKKMRYSHFNYYVLFNNIINKTDFHRKRNKHALGIPVCSSQVLQ